MLIGRSAEWPWRMLLSAAATTSTQDPLASMTLLRVLKQLCNKIENVEALHKAGLLAAIHSVMTPALASGDDSQRSQKQAFPVLKNAFCATDVLLRCAEASDAVFQDLEQQGAITWLFECCRDILRLHDALAWHAIETTNTLKTCLTLRAETQTQAHEAQAATQEQGHETQAEKKERQGHDLQSGLLSDAPAPGEMSCQASTAANAVVEENSHREAEVVVSREEDEASAGLLELAAERRASASAAPTGGAPSRVSVRVGEILREIGFSVPEKTRCDLRM